MVALMVASVGSNRVQGPTTANQQSSVVQIPILNPLFAPLRSTDMEEPEVFNRSSTWNTETIEELKKLMHNLRQRNIPP